MRNYIEELQAGLTFGFHTHVPVLPHPRVNMDTQLKRINPLKTIRERRLIKTFQNQRYVKVLLWTVQRKFGLQKCSRWGYNFSG